jgi:cobalt-zinc-cadmium efflux system membrane fusion protein
MPMQTTKQLATADQGKGQSGPAPLPSAPGPRAEGTPRTPPWRRVVNVVVLVLVLVALAGLGGGYLLGLPLPGLAAPAREDKPKETSLAASVALVKDRPHTLEVPTDVGTVLGFRKGQQDLLAVAEEPSVMRPLTLAGSTALDPTRLARIRARFAPARVVGLGTINDLSPRTGRTEPRELRPGDRVRKGDVLGVFYSVDVGSKKNDLLNALVQLELDQKILDNAEKHKEALSDAQWLTFVRAVQGDRNEISRALNNLEVWDIPQDEIDALHEEAKKISADKDAWFKTREGRWVKGEKHGGKKDDRNENPWGKVTLRAPFDGVIVERNLHVDEMVVDNTVNLFQIADVDRLLVVANAPEDDLPTLETLAHEKRWWSVRTAGAAAGKVQFKLTDTVLTALRAADVPAAVVAKLDPLKGKEFTESEPFVQEMAKLLDKDDLRRFQTLILDLADTNVLLGPIEEISYLIDPNQHTAIIKGYIANPGARIRAGQYVSATVRVPRPAGVVEVPMDAVVDDGKQSLVFVQTGKNQYTMRRVQVTHRFEQRAFVRSTPIPEKERLTPQEAEEGLLPKEPLQPGERVLQSGAGELKAALLELESQPKTEAGEDKR